MPIRGHSRSWPLILLLGVILYACGGGPSGTASPTATTGGGTATDGTSGREASLCDAFTEALAVAALGGPVAAPQGGDVVPRPNGIYCRYSSAADAKVNVEAQLKDMTRAEFDRLAGILGMTEPLAGVGEAAFQLGRSTLGGPGASVAAFGGGRGVTVIINGQGDPGAQIAAAAAIAAAALASGA
jgi:hypothetical protein